MRIVIAGGTGLLGNALVRALRAESHDVRVLTRRPGREGEIGWNPADTTGPWTTAVAQADAVINLAGAPLDGGRWTESRKRDILGSRVVATRAIATVIAGATRAPAVLLNASAVGIYGPRGDEEVTEQTPAGSDFLAGVCEAWEREAGAADATTRVVRLRTGLVLAGDGGALPQLARPFYFLAGGPVGSGRQWWSWIHIEDWVALVLLAVQTSTLSGAINLTAPAPVRNRDFARMLGHALGRPALLTTPAFALRLLLGEMADALILTGQRVKPDRALSAGFTFRFPTLPDALGSIYPR